MIEIVTYKIICRLLFFETKLRALERYYILIAKRHSIL